ncbi:YbhB/YbcL family Raf kinase inhibitor-like protein [uncultured Microscilla sp.]|uniref:YbhB/YbcL family Raf kinase inhibitor-like protein n=1 Tax=uncultured Microscilla sp. TaxID=432653 RepID=UPI002616D485|nr:YbhB/YbcL family Raf kinase inhibitor-like protein [uncultured Microscilla sp.]
MFYPYKTKNSSNTRLLVMVLVLFIFTTTSCKKKEDDVTPTTTTTTDFTLTSGSVSTDGALSVDHTCDGAGTSPQLSWANAPEGTACYAITMHHIPGPGDEHVYMVVYNIPVATTSLASGETSIGSWGVNTVNEQAAYTPPCSQGTGTKEYILTVHALSACPTISSSKVTKAELETAIKDITLGTTTKTITYTK